MRDRILRYCVWVCVSVCVCAYVCVCVRVGVCLTVKKRSLNVDILHPVEKDRGPKSCVQL